MYKVSQRISQCMDSEYTQSGSANGGGRHVPAVRPHLSSGPVRLIKTGELP